MHRLDMRSRIHARHNSLQWSFSAKPHTQQATSCQNRMLAGINSRPLYKQPAHSNSIAYRMHSSMLPSTSGRCHSFGSCRPHTARMQAVQHQQLLRPVCSTNSRRRLCCYAASNTGSSNSFAQKAQAFAETTQQRFQDFVQEQKLDEKAAEASKTAKEKLTSAYEETEQNVRRTYMKLESEHNIRERVERFRKSVNETVRDVDQEYSVSRRFKSAYDDAKRKFPVWKRQFNEFSSTQVGKATLTLAFVGLLFSGLLWQLLNLFWLLWWVSVPVSLYLASQGRKAAEQQTATGQSPSGRSSSPFGDRWSGFNSSSTNSSSYSSSSYRGNDGPVVDAEWVSLDDDDSSSSSRRRR